MNPRPTYYTHMMFLKQPLLSYKIDVDALKFNKKNLHIQLPRLIPCDLQSMWRVMCPMPYQRSAATLHVHRNGGNNIIYIVSSAVSRVRRTYAQAQYVYMRHIIIWVGNKRMSSTRIPMSSCTYTDAVAVDV